MHEFDTADDADVTLRDRCVQASYEKAIKGRDDVCDCNLIVFQDGHKYLTPAGQASDALALCQSCR